MIDVTTISIIIAIIGCIIGVSGWIRTGKKDASEKEAAESEVKTTLDFISNDLKEVKVDIRSFNRDMQEIRTIAIAAQNEAQRANDRLNHLNL